MSIIYLPFLKKLRIIVHQLIEVFPYRLIKRINMPDTINFFILHEGLISLLNEELLEKKYSAST